MTGSSAPFLDVADRIGSRLCRDALWAGRRCNWLGWGAEWTGQALFPVYRAQTASVYDGTAGVALFLSQLVAFTGDARQRTTLEGALNQASEATAQIDPGSIWGFYSGVAGFAAACFHAAVGLRDDRWLQIGLERLAMLAVQVPDPTRLDIMSGCAGSAIMLLHAARRFDRKDFLAAACAQGDFLLNNAVTSDAGVCWNGADGARLLGYSHGAGGIACALYELAAVTGDSRYRATADEALRFERSHFSPQWRNWPDLRRLPTSPPESVNYPVAWCHGATGIGFSRLRIRQLLGDTDRHLSEEIATAIETTRLALAQPVVVGQGYCLCHGAGGQIDLLIEAATVLDQPALREVAEAAGRHGAAYYHDTHTPWPGGVPAIGETPNLMLGIAGIGHVYLRLHAPDTTPTMLSLTPGTLMGREDAVAREQELAMS